MRYSNIFISTMKYITQKEAQLIDKELVEKYKFSVPQLIELAGLSVSHAIYECYKPSIFTNILVCVGAGNNGCDGLVSARNLSLMGYNVSIYCPKEGKSEIFSNLFAQAQFYNVRTISTESEFSSKLNEKSFELIVDALFGFSFKPPLRPPYDTIIHTLSSTSIPICSVDLPSGIFYNYI
uniref:NAD(P)H-hydrate epimerase n=1 Tax=Henneguya salminicola TaxID=69463 RepID=A0A6G3MHE2_HENSL